MIVEKTLRSGPMIVETDRESPDHRPRRIPVQAWYPSTKAAGTLEEDAPPHNAPMRVAVFHHGHGGVRDSNESLFRALASRGYLVLSADHAGVARLARYPGETPRGMSSVVEEIFGSGDVGKVAADPRFKQLGALLAADVRLELDAIAGAFPQADLRRVVLMGHSLGGAVMASVCRSDPRCAALVNLDGPPMLDVDHVDGTGRAVLWPQPLWCPTLIFSTGGAASQPLNKAAWAAVDLQAQHVLGPVLHWRLEDAGHLDVTDAALFVPPVVTGWVLGPGQFSTRHPYKTVVAVNTAVERFLARHLECDLTVDPSEVAKDHPVLTLGYVAGSRPWAATQCAAGL
jgi:dienelactone hydrolase